MRVWLFRKKIRDFRIDMKYKLLFLHYRFKAWYELRKEAEEE